MQLQLVDQLVTLPGSCKGCGTGDPKRGPFLDTGLSEEFYGAVAYCKACIVDMAGMMGCIGPDQATVIRNSMASLEEQNFNLQKQVDGLEKAVAGLSSARSVSSRIPFSSSSLNVPVEVSNEESPAGETDLGSGEGETSESGDDQRVGELHSDGQSDESAFRLSL